VVLEQYVSWSEVDSIVATLSKTILKSSRMFSSISTLSRGGLIPSRLLADYLGIKKIFVDEKIISSDSIFVDDIFDSGRTFESVISNVDKPSNFFFVTLFARYGNSYPSQLIYGKETNNDGYVVFPWDKLEFKRSKN